LLTHTSGIGYGIIDGNEQIKMIYQKAGITDLFTTEKITIAESVKKLVKLPLHHNPGEKYTYSEGTFQWGGYFNTSYFAGPKENVIGLIFKQT